MTKASAPNPQPTRSRTANKAPLRWLLLLLLSIFLHVLFINWSGHNLGLPSSTRQIPTAITAELKPLPPVIKPVLSPEPVEPTPPPKPVQKPVVKATSKPSPKQSPEPNQPEATAAVIPEPVLPVQEPVAASPTPEAPTIDDANGTAEHAVSTPATEAKTEPPAEPTPAPAPPAAVHYKTDPPPSVELKYDVQALNKGQTYYGGGKITWQTDGAHYTINGEAGALFITALDFKSTGELNGFGISPILYTEKKFRKSATNTHFHRERNAITFSASTNSYPRTGGEQDRASIVWQLASIGRGDASKFVAGGVVDMFVAGTRDAETWRFQIVGEEPITVGTGDTNAWHVTRIPQPGSYEQKLDIWLAPDQQWYPLKLRFTETNGDYLEMSLTKLKSIPPLSLD